MSRRRRARCVPCVLPLEPRRLLAQLEFAGGVLTYTAADGEPNAVATERATIGGQSWLRVRESGGMSIVAIGTGVVVESAVSARVLASSVLQFDVTLGDGDDRATIGLDALPARMTVDAGTDQVSGAIRFNDSAANDAVALAPIRYTDGTKFIQLARGSSQVSFGRFTSLIVDVSRDGADSVTLNRYLTGIDRPLNVALVGGGAGTDTLIVESPGDVAQRVDVDGDSIRFANAEEGTEVLLGPSDNVAIDQPKAQIEVIRDEGGEPVSMGPEAFNSFLLDTGATGIVVTANPTVEMMEYGYEVYDIPYDESGVSGATPMDVSLPYRVDFAGTSGERNTLEDFQLLSSLDLEFSFFGPWGIIGMPAMVGRVTTIDMSRWSNIIDVEDLPLHVEFGTSVPADTGHSYSIPLELEEFPHTGQRPGGPVPTFAPLPFLNVELQNDGVQVPSRFLLDTGAQLSIISTRTAIALGLDVSGDGSLDDEALEFIEVSGVGGTTAIPLVAYDRFSVATEEGSDLIWTNLLAGVIDIETGDGPVIDGVLGMDFLTSGWAAKILPIIVGEEGSDVDGYFSHVYFDFLDADEMRGRMVLDVIPIHDEPGAPDEVPFEVAHAGFDVIRVRGGDGDDTFWVTPQVSTTVDVDGRAHGDGDTLNVETFSLPATNDGVRVRVPGYQDVTYTRVESVNVGGADPTGPEVTRFTITDDTGVSGTDRVTFDRTLELVIELSEPTTGSLTGVTVLTPLNQPVTPTGMTGNGTSTIRITLPSQFREGAYTVRLDADTFVDADGNPLGGGTDFVSGFTLDRTRPVADVLDVSPDPRSTPVVSIRVDFGEAVAGVTLSDFRLTRDGGPNLLDASVTVTSGDQRIWMLNNLTALTSTPGAYTLTLVAARSGITDIAGNTLWGDAADTFVIGGSVITVDDIAVTEGDSGTLNAVFHVRLTGPLASAVTVNYATADGTAVAGRDYNARSGVLRFNPGVVEQTVSVPVRGDLFDEADERFFLRLSGAVGAGIGDGEGVATIRDNDPAATVAVMDVAVNEGAAGAVTRARFTITLTGTIESTATVHYHTVNGTATSASGDYVALGDTLLSFAPGERTKYVYVDVNGDASVEPTETYSLVVDQAVGVVISDGSGLGTIINDDLGISAAAVSVVETNAGTTTAQVVFTLVGDIPGRSFNVAFDYATADGTGATGATVANNDYTAASGRLTFAPGVSMRTVSLTIRGDARVEPSEYFMVALSNPADAVVRTRQARVTIVNDDTSVSIGDAAPVTEPASGSADAVFVVSIPTAVTFDVTANYDTYAGTARSGIDFTRRFGTVVIPAGQRTAEVRVPILPDALDEPNEDFRVRLVSATNAVVGDGEGVGTIVDDDPLPSLSIGDWTGTEGGAGTTKTAAFVVTLSAPSGKWVSVRYATVNGTATTANGDYNGKSGLLNIRPGDTSASISVTVRGDAVVEPNETFFVTLSSAVEATIADGSGLGTIQNDDGPLRLAGGIGRQSGRTPGLTDAALAALAKEASRRWALAGVDAGEIAALGQLTFRVARLPGNILAYSDGSTVTIDADAAGRGWIIDTTPGDDAEFTGAARVKLGRRVDLLTTLIHEVGHAIGREHEETGAMAGTLAGATRLAPASDDELALPAIHTKGRTWRRSGLR